MRLDELFVVKNGIASSELVIHASKVGQSIPFIRPSSTQNRTIAGWINPMMVKDEHIHPSESLFVSTNGEGSHSYSYVSRFEFVPNSDVSVLIPKREMTLNEKLFYARCITMNRYRFSYGRKPKGDRLKSIELPDSVPNWVSKLIPTNINTSTLVKLKSLSSTNPPTDKVEIKTVKIREIFELNYGSSLELSRLKLNESGINFVARTSKNNGISAHVDIPRGIDPIPAGCITVALSGSVLESFVQYKPFITGFHVMVLRPKFDLKPEEMQFYATCIRANQSRYSYGRQANRTLKDLTIPSRDSIPAWVYGSINKIADELLVA